MRAVPNASTAPPCISSNTKGGTEAAEPCRFEFNDDTWVSVQPDVSV